MEWKKESSSGAGMSERSRHELRVSLRTWIVLLRTAHFTATLPSWPTKSEEESWQMLLMLRFEAPVRRAKCDIMSSTLIKDPRPCTPRTCIGIPAIPSTPSGMLQLLQNTPTCS